MGLGQSAGSEMWLEDRAGIGLQRLAQVADDFVKESHSESDLRTVNSTFRAGTRRSLLMWTGSKRSP